LRDSGAIEQDADLVVMMYREEYYNKETINKGLAEAIIAKQRMGETGTVLLTFQGEFSRFVDFAGQYHKETQKKSSRGFDDGKSKGAGE
jgi:replicative DNA helicase